MLSIPSFIWALCAPQQYNDYYQLLPSRLHFGQIALCNWDLASQLLRYVIYFLFLTQITLTTICLKRFILSFHRETWLKVLCRLSSSKSLPLIFRLRWAGHSATTFNRYILDCGYWLAGESRPIWNEICSCHSQFQSATSNFSLESNTAERNIFASGIIY